ncbi:hypothetical protein [Phaeobacter inhibens]|uniref:hypothetical protein n=1 Tax=Phaeobacter inhibens TaxID=221822 RepID=UPI0021A73866|nr:hypothetical protein [Phaeobacter inhibens]
MARPIRFLFSFLVLVTMALPGWSQDGPNPLRIGFLSVPPFAQRDSQGQETGFSGGVSAGPRNRVGNQHHTGASDFEP